MIKEFAIDPEVIIDPNCKIWSSLVEFSAVRGKVLSEFPVGWLKKHGQTLAKSTSLPGISLAQQRERFLILDRASVKWRQGHYNNINTWEENVQIEHNRNPFYRVIQKLNPNCLDYVFDENKCTVVPGAFDVPSSMAIPRTVEQFVEAIKPLARLSDHYKFVDPYFAHDDAYTVVFREVMRMQDVDPPLSVEIHRFLKGSDKAEDVVNSIVDAYRDLIPRNTECLLYVWGKRDAVKDGGHARYFLTEKGGISFDSGLQKGNDTQRTDVYLLDKGHFDQRSMDYHPQDSLTFKLRVKKIISGIE